MITFAILMMYTFSVERELHFPVFMDSNDILIIAVSANILHS